MTFNTLAKAASLATLSLVASAAMAQEVTLKFRPIWPSAAMAAAHASAG